MTDDDVVVLAIGSPRVVLFASKNFARSRNKRSTNTSLEQPCEATAMKAYSPASPKRWQRGIGFGQRRMRRWVSPLLTAFTILHNIAAATVGVLQDAGPANVRAEAEWAK